MLKYLISHFYNEEYLLPWWLEHHKRIFDHGIMINYASTDTSTQIIKDICPTWEVINSRFDTFDAELIESEVIEIEKSVTGWKMCLNTTEFLIGNFTGLDDSKEGEYIVPCHTMVDVDPDSSVDRTLPLVNQKYHGIHCNHRIRRPRKIHNKAFEAYPIGRHYPYESVNNWDMAVLWYGFSPFNADTIRRKLQIQTRIPEKDKQRGFGAEHITDEQKLRATHASYLNHTEDLRPFFKRFAS